MLIILFKGLNKKCFSDLIITISSLVSILDDEAITIRDEWGSSSGQKPFWKQRRRRRRHFSFTNGDLRSFHSHAHHISPFLIFLYDAAFTVGISTNINSSLET